MDEKEKLYKDFMQKEGMFKFYKGFNKAVNHRNYFFYTDKLVSIIDSHAGFGETGRKGCECVCPLESFQEG